MNPLITRATAIRSLLFRAGTTLLVAGLPAFASIVAIQGTFSTDDEVHQVLINLNAPSPVTIQSFGYAGGKDALNNVIAPGGFDTVLTLFDGNGGLITSNNDGACGVVGKDSGTLNCFDSYLSVNLTPGSYTLVLTEDDNLANGPALADGFTQTGYGNFSCPEFLGIAGAFCDASPSHRDGNWALTIATSQGESSAPEPAPVVLLLSGLAFLLTARSFSFWRKS